MSFIYVKPINIKKRTPINANGNLNTNKAFVYCSRSYRQQSGKDVYTSSGALARSVS